jgi:8-oxo-dGTP diphosphatase
MSETTIQVAVAIVSNKKGDVLIAKRRAHQHLGGYWEFPGGKIEPGEAPIAALTRELQEEVGLSARKASPLVTIEHDYDAKRVCLHVFTVSEYSGVAKSCEGQAIAWVALKDLSDYKFPAANAPIIERLLGELSVL